MKPTDTIQYIPTYIENGGDMYDRLRKEIAEKGGITLSRDKMTLLEDPGIRNRKDILGQRGFIYKVAQGTLAAGALVHTLNIFEHLNPLHNSASQYATQIGAVGAAWLICSLGLKGMHKIKSNVNLWRLDRSLRHAHQDLQTGHKPELLDTAERSGKFFWPLIWAGSGVMGLRVGTLLHDTIKGINQNNVPAQLLNPGGIVESLHKVANAGLSILNGSMDTPALSLAAFGCGGLALGIATGLRLTVFSRTIGVIKDLRENAATLTPGNLGKPGGRGAVVTNTAPDWLGTTTRTKPLWRQLAESRMETTPILIETQAKIETSPNKIPFTPRKPNAARSGKPTSKSFDK